MPDLRGFLADGLLECFEEYAVDLDVLADLLLRCLRLLHCFRFRLQEPIGIHSHLVNHQRLLDNEPDHGTVPIDIIPDSLDQLQQDGLKNFLADPRDNLSGIVPDQFHNLLSL